MDIEHQYILSIEYLWGIVLNSRLYENIKELIEGVQQEK